MAKKNKPTIIVSLQRMFSLLALILGRKRGKWNFCASYFSVCEIATAARRHKSGWRQSFTLLCQRAPLSSLLFNRMCMHNMSKRRARNSRDTDSLVVLAFTAIANSQKMIEASSSLRIPHPLFGNNGPYLLIFPRRERNIDRRLYILLFLRFLKERRCFLLTYNIKSVDCCHLFYFGSTSTRKIAYPSHTFHLPFFRVIRSGALCLLET